MADVIIQQTKPVIVDENWPPKIEEPVQSDRTNFFPPAPQPVIRSDAPIILGLTEVIREESDKTPVTVGSTESRFTANLQPVSNDSSAGKIYGEGPTQTRVNLPKPPNPIAGNMEVQMVANPGPISNDPGRTIMSSPGSNHSPNTPLVDPSDNQNRKNTVTNEETRFTYAPQHSAAQGDTFVPIPPWQSQSDPRTDGVLRHVTAGNKDVHFVPGPPAQLNVEHATTFGGGGDPTKAPGQDDTKFAGISGPSTMNIGSNDTVLVPSGDITRQANEDDRVLTPNVGAVGNHETLRGSSGGASVGNGNQEVGFGGKNKPKNVKG
jgi:hypothetical protein